MMTLSDYIEEKKPNHGYVGLSDEKILSFDIIDLSSLGLEYIHPNLNNSRKTLILRNNLIKEIPEWFSKKKGRLDLGQNLITKLLTNGNLKVPIFLDNNSIKEIPDDFILYNAMVLKNNLIEKIREDFFQNYRLNLNYNNIKIIPKGFHSTVSLSIKYNPIIEIHPTAVLDKITKEKIINSDFYKRNKNQKEFLKNLKP